MSKKKELKKMAKREGWSKTQYKAALAHERKHEAYEAMLAWNKAMDKTIEDMLATDRPAFATPRSWKEGLAKYDSVNSRLHPAIGERSSWIDMLDDLPDTLGIFKSFNEKFPTFFNEHDDNEAELIWSAMRTWNRRD